MHGVLLCRSVCAGIVIASLTMSCHEGVNVMQRGVCYCAGLRWHCDSFSHPTMCLTLFIVALLLCEGLMLDDPDWDTRHSPQVVGMMLVDPCGTRGTPLLH